MYLLNFEQPLVQVLFTTSSFPSPSPDAVVGCFKRLYEKVIVKERQKKKKSCTKKPSLGTGSVSRGYCQNSKGTGFSGATLKYESESSSFNVCQGNLSVSRTCPQSALHCGGSS